MSNFYIMFSNSEMLSSFFKRISLRKENLFLFSFLLIIITMPVSPNLNSICIIFLSIIWVITGGFLKYNNFFNFNFLSHVVLYSLFVIGVIYSDDKKYAFFQLEQKFSLLAFPIIFSTIPKIKTKHFHFILHFFVLSTFLFSIYCLACAFYYSYQHDSSSLFKEIYFTNQTLAGYIGFHSTYFSLYIIFSILIIVQYLFKNRISTLEKIFVLLIVTFFLVFLFLLASRIILASLCIMLLVLFIKILIDKKIQLIYVFYIAVFCIGSVFFVSKNEYFKNRANEVFSINTLDLIGSNNENGITQRVFFWKNAVEIIKRSPLIGFGTGDVNTQFDKQYDKLLLENPNYPLSVIAAINFFKNENYNAHSQYLQILISFGIIGLLIFLAYLFNLLLVSIRNKNPLYLTFLLITMLVFFTESVLERHYGIVFFTFFNSLFLFHSPDKNST